MMTHSSCGRLFTLGYSPCPNDTFIFYALAQGRIDLLPDAFSVLLADVEVLNQKARQHELDISKVSINALAHLLDEYWLLRAGGALGRGCGPLVVAREPLGMEELRDQPMAIPGKLTTANLLLQLHGEHHGERIEMAFDQIMPAVSRGDVSAGVVIHEGRFTYGAMGLHAVLDLGAWWESSTALPLPLGGIVMKRSLGADAARSVEAKIRASLLYARLHHQEAWPYILAHAQELEPAVIQRHIDTFVNDFSVNVSSEGERAIRALVQAACRQAGTAFPVGPLFWTDDATA
jgi:1,4-dihydroxy-6-naphthoate synthase